MTIQHLYIDELGSPNPHSGGHKYFIVCACTFPDGTREQAKVLADQIKYKYWGKSDSRYQDVVFHSMDIGRKSGAFAIFQNNQALYDEFIDDLFKLLKFGNITIFVNVTDLAAAKAKNWSDKKVLDEASDHIMKSFVYYLIAGKSKGKIVLESATDLQNTYFMKAFGFYLSPQALPQIDFKSVQDALTSISFVTKNNHDIEEQMADLFAYAARCKYEKEELGVVFPRAGYESKVLAILESKLFKTPPQAAPIKKALFDEISGYKIITK